MIAFLLKTASPLGLVDLATVMEWCGSLLGLLGAYLLAFNTRVSRWGWVAFFTANVATVLFAFLIDRNGLLLQQIGFVGSSLLGICRSGLIPWLKPQKLEPNWKVTFPRELREKWEAVYHPEIQTISISTKAVNDGN